MISRFSADILIPAGETSVTVYVGPPGLSGRIHAIKITESMTTPLFTITGEKTGVPIFAMASAVSGWYYPRVLLALNTAGGTPSTDVFADINILEERIKVAVTAALAAETGSIEIWVDDGRT